MVMDGPSISLRDCPEPSDPGNRGRQESSVGAVRGPLRRHRAPHGMKPAPHVMAKPAGPTCTMECAYCFYLDKQALFPKSSLRMTPRVVHAVLQGAIDASHDVAIQFCWQGGEPTLRGLDFYREAFALARRMVPPGRHFAWSMQTNGLLIDERWAQFLARNDVLVGLSIDGPRDVHDRWRVDRGGRGTWTKVMRAARLLHDHGVRVNTLTTVHPANQQRGGEVYRFLRDEVGSDFHQYIPVVVPDPARPGHVVRALSVDPDAWGAFQLDVFSQWLHRDVGQIFVMNIEWALAAWCGDEPASCMFRERCGDAVVVEHDGSVYSCDHFVDPAHRLGRVGEESLATMITAAQQRTFGDAKADLPERCRDCPVLFACHGECPKNRLPGEIRLAGDAGEPGAAAGAGVNYLCRGYRHFFTAIDEPMRYLAACVLSGRDPARVMQWAHQHRILEPVMPQADG